MNRRLIVPLALVCAGFSVGAEEPSAVPIDLPGIHNAFRVTARIFSGSQPENDAAFAELARLGVKTIVSVDGAKPDVATARKHGFRYVHLPFGYDGVPAERVAQLARTASTSGAIFVHCHHGKHRGPAAVGVMCEATENWTRERAEAWLRQAGTADDYPGLYRAVRDFSPVPEATLAQVGPLPEIADTPDLVEIMVAIDERFDRLKAAQKTGWKTPAGTVPEATLIWEHLRELARTEDTARRSDDYRTKLAASEKSTADLLAELRSRESDQATKDAALKRTSQTCAACHKTHRNESR